MVRNTKRNRKNYKKRKIMRGGFTGDEETRLQILGFSEEDIVFLQNLDMNMNLIELSLNTINKTTHQKWTPQELIADLHKINNGDGDNDSSVNTNHSLLGNSILSNISNSNESLNLSNISGVSEHDIDDDNNSLNLSDEHEDEDSSLHLSDLEGNPSALTDYPSENSSFLGNSNNSSFLNDSNNSNNSTFLNESNNSNDSHETTRGGKSRKKRSKKNKRKTSKKRSKRVTRKSKYGGQRRTRRNNNRNPHRGNQIRLPQDNTYQVTQVNTEYDLNNTLPDNTLPDNTLYDNDLELNTSKTPGKKYGGFN